MKYESLKTMVKSVSPSSNYFQNYNVSHVTMLRKIEYIYIKIDKINENYI